ncbi:MAG: lactate utilization protein [Thermotogae bacterium]|nr:MAG: lactate utilization protein [Thermotogota bacterium]
MREKLYLFKYENISSKISSVLKKKGYDTYIVSNRDEVRALVESLIPEGSTVSSGGSLTLQECGILDLLRSGKYRFLDRYEASTDIEKLQRETFYCDYYLCSANAVTENGELVFMDGVGNRVAAVSYGPKNVLIVVSVNKVVKDLNAARERIRYIAPMNAKRLNLSTPCAQTGFCCDCDSDQRICQNLLILESSTRTSGRITVVLVTEELGL